jgi:thymidylate synthase
MQQYLNLVERILREGVLKPNRTGVSAYTIVGAMFEHDMEQGFPVLTTKKMGIKSIATELEFFIKGYTDKSWLQERGCTIWDEWCNQQKVPYGTDEETKKKMRDEKDLGPIYGFQWRHFGAEYNGQDYTGKGVDQLKKVVDKLKSDPTDRRMIVSAWNPLALHQMALPPCHYGFQVTVLNDKLNLMWNQRSVDTMIGLPYNVASYGLLLHLLAKETGFREGKLIGFLGDVHIYENHIEGAKEQIAREPKELPKMVTESFTGIFSWKAQDSKLSSYNSHPKIEFPIAI